MWISRVKASQLLNVGLLHELIDVYFSMHFGNSSFDILSFSSLFNIIHNRTRSIRVKFRFQLFIQFWCLFTVIFSWIWFWTGLIWPGMDIVRRNPRDRTVRRIDKPFAISLSRIFICSCLCSIWLMVYEWNCIAFTILFWCLFDTWSIFWDRT